MKDIGVWVGIGFGSFAALGVATGFSLKTKQGWFFILCAFVSGFLMGYLLKDLTAGIEKGIVLAGLAALLGPVMLRNKERFKQQ